MTRHLLLMRHAKSDWNQNGLADHDRPLNARGRSAAPVIAQWLLENQLLPTVLLLSTSLRTRQTLELMQEAWAQSVPALQPQRIEWLEPLYLASPERIWNIASNESDAETLLVLGHNPGMELLVSHLSNQAVEMPTAAVAVFQTRENSWNAQSCDESCWKWRGMVKPRELGK